LGQQVRSQSAKIVDAQEVGQRPQAIIERRADDQAQLVLLRLVGEGHDQLPYLSPLT
jgi:hypothetical protein